VSFNVDGYRKDRTLVIDPIVYSTLLSGPGGSSVNGMKVGSDGSAYVTGWTQYGFNVPTTDGTTYLGNHDAFLARLDANGSLYWCTIFGGHTDDSANDISLDASGSPYVCGYTASDDFPTTDGSTYLGNRDAFLASSTPPEVAAFLSSSAVRYRCRQ